MEFRDGNIARLERCAEMVPQMIALSSNCCDRQRHEAAIAGEGRADSRRFPSDDPSIGLHHLTPHDL